MVGSAEKPVLNEPLPPLGMAAVIVQVKQKPGAGLQLLAYLPQQHAIYRGKSTNAVKRERAQLFAAFRHTGLPESALPYVLEVLETEPHAYLVAGAARALRGWAEPRSWVVPYLLRAFQNVKCTDDTVLFDAWEPTDAPGISTTALQELCQTFRWFGAHARSAVEDLRRLRQDGYINARIKAEIEQVIQAIEADDRNVESSCCDHPFRRSGPFLQSSHQPDEVVLEDQEGQKRTYREIFAGKPSVVVFFYTRCDNPNKCSLTISRVRELQQNLRAEGLDKAVRVAAITYDPYHDDPFRMKAYCEVRNLTLDDENRVFRAETGLPELLHYFDSGVNYAGSLVNHHATELFVLNASGAIVSRYGPLQWSGSEVVADLKNRVNEKPQKKLSISGFLKNKIAAFVSPILSFVIVFFPKCPLCWTAYLSVFGITNMHVLRLASRSQPLLIALLGLNLVVLFRGAQKRNGLLPFYCSVLGLVCILFFGPVLQKTGFAYPGIGLLLLGALLNSLPPDRYMRFRLGFSRIMAACAGLKTAFEKETKGGMP